NQFTGFLLFDPDKNDTILNYNGEKYFTPASNTKIFTLFTALNMLPDSIPALKYTSRNDTLYIQGTGDPTLLHSYFRNNKTLEFLNKFHNVAINLNNIEDAILGPGWAWDDYDSYYQPEKSSFPLYGNVVILTNTSTPKVTPVYFKDSTIPVLNNKNRALNRNTFYFDILRKDTLEVPFKTDISLTKRLLENELNKDISIIPKMPNGELKVKYSVPTDSVLKHMMHESDNFLAEQLLIVASSTLSDTLSSKKTQDYMTENLLSDLKQPPRWADGSGLSRYNLFTPASLVQVLEKMYRKIPRKRLFTLFPSPGDPGTLKSWNPKSPQPYIYAKSGSLGNVYCMSGYLITKSGRTLIFSFMNNHFRSSSLEVKEKMREVFEMIRYTY
ncbi:MAG: D-alanyl-D-alanine carboxypeptidase, partial [Maribacter sp.]